MQKQYEAERLLFGFVPTPERCEELLYGKLTKRDFNKMLKHPNMKEKNDE